MDTVHTVEKKIGGDGNVAYWDSVTTQRYLRMAGGLAWPSRGKAGYLVAVGEARAIGERSEYHVVADSEADGLEGLLRKAMELRSRFGTDDWWGETGLPPMAQFLSDFNRDRRLSDARSRFILREAPFADSADGLRYYADLIRGMLLPEKRCLFFAAGSALPGHLLGFEPEAADGRATDRPPIAALGFALAALTVYRPVDVRKLQTKAIMYEGEE
jgi:hypothetical protein